MLTPCERRAVVEYALSFPPTTHDQIDCSHFTWAAIKTVRPDFPYLTSGDYAKFLIEIEEPQPADLIHFPFPGHVAILILEGEQWFIGSQSSTGVCIVSLDNPYWSPLPHRYLQIS